MKIGQPASVVPASRIAVASLFVMVAGTAAAQTVSQGGSAGTTFTSPIASTLIPYNSAIPIPLGAVYLNNAFPAQRGFVRAEPFFIYPSVALGFGNNSNVLLQKDNTLSTSIVQMSPKVVAELKSGGSAHAFSYQGSFSRYSKSSADNTDDHELVAQTRNQFSARADLNGQAYYLSRSEPRFSLNRTSGDRPDHFNAFGALGTFGYGAQAAQGRFEVDMGFTDKSYTNNRLVTEAFDATSFNIAGRFLYRISPRMRLLAEARDTEISFKGSNLDNAERRLLFGAALDGSAALSGTAKIGYVNKNFKDGSLQDFNALAAEVALRWQPLTYSQIDVLAQRLPRDSTGTGTSTLDSVLGVTWNHRWQSFISTYASARYVNSDFKGVSRTDKISNFSVGGYFDIRTWLRLGLRVDLDNRSSTESTVEFKRNLLMFTVGATL